MKKVMTALFAVMAAGAFTVPESWGQASSTTPSTTQPSAKKAKSPCAQFKKGTQERKDCVAQQKAAKKNSKTTG